MNDRSRKKESFTSLIVLIFLCLIGSGFFAFLFFKDLNMSLVKMNEEPIAFISFKYKSASRKFLEREIWDKLKQKSPLYNGDTIRTAPLSEATIYFNEDDKIELYEDSIIQIFMDNGEIVVNIGGGNVIVNAGENSKGIKVRVGKMYTTVKKGTNLSTKKDKFTNVTSFQAIAGGAYIFSDDGESAFVSEVDHIIFAEDGSIIDTSSIPQVTVISPAPNMKILRTEASEKSVKFRWIEKNMEYDHPILKIADNKNFENAKVYNLSGINGDEGIDIDIESGMYYWEMHPANTGDDFKAESRLNIVDAKKPELIIPANEYVIGYRNAIPSVKFSWTDNEWISNYIVELSHSPTFEGETIKIESTESYTVVSNLDDGMWYWRVQPEFGIGLKIPENVSETRCFLIAKSDIMPKAKLLQPTDGFTLNMKTKKSADEKIITFSWRKNPDASFYNIKISRDPEFNFSDLDIETSDNSMILGLEKIEKFLEKSNEWYWAVLQGDENGNISGLSEVRKFSIIDGNYENRLIFPPDGYSVENSRIDDISFIWKSNFTSSGKQIFQIAEDSEFKNIILMNESEKNEIGKDSLDKSKLMRNLEESRSSEGKTYYWRAIVLNDDGEEIISKPNAIKIKPPFKAPESAIPSGRIKVGVAKERPATFEWKAVDGADSYKFKIYQASAEKNIINEKNVIFEDNLVTENHITLDLSGFSNGDYIWTVQANATEKESSTRFTGETGKNEFIIRRLSIASLSKPENGAVIEGLEAFINPIKARWECDEKNILSTFRLYKKNGSEYRLIQTLHNPKKSIQLPRLETGEYKWTVEAITSDGFDVSAEERDFRITQIPQLAEPRPLAPPNQAIIEASDLKRNKSIDFRWIDVDGANDYIITIRDKNGNVIERNGTKNSITFNFKNISSLSKGKFSWSVEARHILKDGTIVRKTSSSPVTFTIELPEIKDVKLNESGELYGL